MTQLEIPGMETDKLTQAKELGEQVILLYNEIEGLEAQIGAKKEVIKKISEELLPEMFDELGIDEISMQDGNKIGLKQFVVGRLSPKTKADALTWLRANNHEGIIKNTVNISLEKGQDDIGNHVLKEMDRLGVKCDRKEDIHPSTLKAFIREQYGQHDFPEDLFNVHEVRKVVFS